ncbi:DUF2520 domain-containing protein [Actinoplanes sp. NPDC048967]|uniref:Rossmann-like and DUF2520 domain-containing protein n=1 Tax=Actinoplanes sp. NPDC048967 TaxID=3155269 RepID=UPI0033C2CB2F
MKSIQQGSIGVIGAGRLGTALGQKLVAMGDNLVGVSARSEASRARAGERLPDVKIMAPAEIARQADCVILAVPDDAIRPMAERLAADGTLVAGQYIMHVSGAHGLASLEPASALGVMPVAMHPAMTFAGQPDDFEKFEQTPFGITAPEQCRPVVEDFVRHLGGAPVWISDNKRTLYHAAMVFGANNLISLVAGAMEIVEQAGVESPGDLLGPILRASLENTLKFGDAALTGPVRRGDLGTVRAHLSSLQSDAPTLVGPYASFGAYTADRAISHKLNDEKTIALVLTELVNRGPAT